MVTQTVTGRNFALKFIVVKTDEALADMKNEVAIMRHVQNNEGMLHVEDVFFYDKRLWIIMDLCEANLTNMCQYHYDEYPEEVVKYILRRTLIPL